MGSISVIFGDQDLQVEVFPAKGAVEGTHGGLRVLRLLKGHKTVAQGEAKAFRARKGNLYQGSKLFKGLGNITEFVLVPE